MRDVIKVVMLNSENEEEKIQEELKECYWGMDEAQQLSCLKGILHYVENSMELYLFFLSYLLEVLNDKKILELIEEILLSEQELSLIDNINIAFQLRRYMFTHKVERTEEENYKMMCSIYSKQVKAVREQLKPDATYIPYNKRNKNRIVLLIEPLLDDRHAPTKKLVNIYHYLEKIGYEVYIYATNYELLQLTKITWWWEAGVSQSLFEENTRFCLDYYGVNIKGCYAMYTENNYLETISGIREEIAKFNPMFVMTIGDGNILGDVCDDFIDVVTMGCTSSVPITTSKIIARYFFPTKELEQKYHKCLGSEQSVIQYSHTDELGSAEEQEYTREKLQIKNEDFLVVIAGHRLDDEVKSDTIEVLYSILENEPKCKILFIGNWDKLKQKLELERFFERFRFIEETINFKETIGLGDLFLNPPRVGGGTGALYAVENDIPVLTLGNCDVANMGEGFVCERLEDMPEIVHRYINDSVFMKQQKEYCRRRIKEINTIDNLEQTRKFCKEVEEVIKKKEEKMIYNNTFR